MSEIFKALTITHNLTHLNIAFNTIEYGRYRSAAMDLFETISAFLYASNKLVHLDMSGCNLGPHIVEIGPAIAKSLTLQSVHLH